MPAADTLPEDRRKLVADIEALGDKWHPHGSVSGQVLEAFARRCPPGGFRNTLETGCGRTTLLLSRLSRRHTVFTMPSTDSADTNADGRVRQCPLFRPDAIQFVFGPTQKTVPGFAFDGPYDLVLLDGPHAFPFVELEYYFVYPHLAAGGWLVLDDVHIPNIRQMLDFLREDEMFELDEVVDTTAFLARTAAPTFDPYGDSWRKQRYNARRFPIPPNPPPPTSPLRRAAGRVLPGPVKSVLRKALGRA